MTPQPVKDLDLAFPTSVAHLMPAYATIPDEFKHGRTIWSRLVNDWFFCGIEGLQMEPKEGIDRQMAMRHIRAIIGSFEPKHEHVDEKEAACAYLLSLWFDNPTWEKGGES